MGWAIRWDYPSFFLRTCATATCTGRAGAEATKRASSLPEETWRCNGWMELRVTKRHQRYLSRIDQCCPFRALRELVWVDVSATRVAAVYANAPLCNRQLTERRILDGRRHGKAHFACGPHQRAHSACERSHGVRFSVRWRVQTALLREAVCAECAFA